MAARQPGRPRSPRGRRFGFDDLTIPAGTAAGAYFVIAKADADGANAESNENNNTASSTVMAVGPDLVVSTLLAPASAGAGSAAVVGNTIKNQGGGPAGASTAKFYLSTDAILDAQDVLLGSRAVPVGPGRRQRARELTIPTGTPLGTYFVIIKADADGAVPEVNEDNNTSVSGGVTLGADLVVTSVTAPAAVVPGATVSVKDTTRNESSTAVGASTTRFYLSGDTVLDGGDVVLGTRAVPALGPGGQNTRVTSLAIPASTGGQFYIIAQANADGAIPETDTTNNTAVSQLIKVGADLVVTLTTVPATAGVGATITVTSTTRNFGGVSASASTTRFYLSADAVLDAADNALGSRAIGILAPQTGASTGSTALTIPVGTAAGAYFLIARADADGVVVEMDETNNTDSRAIAIGSDLTITQVSAPAHAGSGATIAVSDTTQNGSAGPAAASTTRFYLSTDTTLDAADLSLGSRAVPALAGGASSTATTTLTIPTGIPAGLLRPRQGRWRRGHPGAPTRQNNAGSGEVKLGPDLVADCPHAPADGSPRAGRSPRPIRSRTTAGAAGAFTSRASTRPTTCSTPAISTGSRRGGRRGCRAALAEQHGSGRILALPAGLTWRHVLHHRPGRWWRRHRRAGRGQRVGAVDRHRPDGRPGSTSAASSFGARPPLVVTDVTRNQRASPSALPPRPSTSRPTRCSTPRIPSWAAAPSHRWAPGRPARRRTR
jgi:subtilase family serine protease